MRAGCEVAQRRGRERELADNSLDRMEKEQSKTKIEREREREREEKMEKIRKRACEGEREQKRTGSKQFRQIQDKFRKNQTNSHKFRPKFGLNLSEFF